jgi:predicted ATPase
LRATLDWSYELLSDPERCVLRRLAVFVGGFTLEAAGAVAAAGDIGEPTVVGAVVDLVTKSLVVMDADLSKVRYRLLETTRAYALEQLNAAGECDATMRRHAEHYRDFCAAEIGGPATWRGHTISEACRREVGNIRAALDWAFSPPGDAAIGVAITLASLPLWLYLWLIDACRRYIEKALSSAPARSDRQLELRLLAALVLAQMGEERPTPEAAKALENALEIAESLDDPEYRARAICGLWVYHAMRGNHRAALPVAQKLRGVSADGENGAVAPIGDWLLGMTLQFQGELAAARRLLESPVGAGTSVSFALARVLCLQGYPEQAMHLVARSLRYAAAAARVSWHCSVLSEGACTIALMTCDLAAFERYLLELCEVSERHSFDFWLLRARCFKAVLRMRRGDGAGGVQALRDGIDALGPTSFGQVGIFSLELARGLGTIDQIGQALDVVDATFELVERNEERWFLAELLHVRGLLLLRDGKWRDVQSAEAQFERALAVAGQQGALFWQLRTATSLARLWQQQGRAAEARDLLAPLYQRFTEGLGSADLQAAGRVLDGIRAAVPAA